MATSHAENLPVRSASRSTGEIVQDILDTVQDIFRSEVQVVKTEMADRARQAGKAAGMLGGGVVLLLFAAALAIVSAVAALALVMPVWLASLLVAAALGIAGGIMAAAGRRRLKHTSLKPEQAIDGVKEDVRWLKQQTS
jgi:Flp pilus assembly protein TadB